MNLNLLQKKTTVIKDPYPHIVIEDALPWDVYEELERTFPENAVLSTEPLDQGISPIFRRSIRARRAARGACRPMGPFRGVRLERVLLEYRRSILSVQK